jgi:hypothetical protein
VPSQPNPFQRQLSDADVSHVLRLAAELQHRASATASGLTVGDVERIGAEVGIEPKYVRAAALLSTATRHESRLVRTVLGKAPGIGIVVTFQGFVDAIDAEQRLERVMADAFGPMRRVHAFGSTLAWDSTSSRASATRVTIIPGRDESRLVVDHDLSAVARNVFTAAIAGLGVFGGAIALAVVGATTNSPGLALGAVGTLLAASVVAARLVYGSLRARHVTVLNDLIGAVVAEFASSPSGAA